MKVSRRCFIKSSAAGAAGLAVAGSVHEAAAAPGAWSTGMAINPSIDNLRVVSYRDPAMVSQNAPILNFASMAVQNNAAVTNVIQANMDQMARALAAQSDIATAWRTIFRRPPSKTWSQVRVAIKVNGLFDNHPRAAVVDKICRVLNAIDPGAADVNDRSVPYANIIIYDGCSSASPLYNSFVGTRLPTGVRVSDGNGLLNGTVSAAIPAPYNGSQQCTADIANGVIDILVNCAVNKAHSNYLGSVTLSMKNHYGTFPPGGDPHYNATSFNYVIGINKSDAIVGGTPPRQQLCIIDSLWACVGGPGGEPDASGNVYRLVMGTFGPAVDYLTAKKIREVAPMNASHDTNYLNRFVTEFGYTTGQRDTLLTLTPAPLTAGPGWVDLSGPVEVEHAQRSSGAGERSYVLHATNAAGTGSSVQFRLPASAGGVQLTITDAKGSLVRELTGGGGGALWDGRTSEGRVASAGTYLVRLSAGSFSDVQRLTLAR